MSEMTKEIAFFCISECSVSYQKLLQMSEMTKEIAFFCISECSVSYQKLLQMSEMTKENTMFSFVIYNTCTNFAARKQHDNML